MPALAHQKSTAGAKAFVRYYIDVLNFAFAELRQAQLGALSPASCSLCRSFVDILRRLMRDDGAQIGGTWAPVSVHPLGQDKDSAFFLAEIDVAEGTSYASPNAPRHHIEAKQMHVTFELHPTPTGWRIQDVYPA
jgi:hypothetical protein